MAHLLLLFVVWRHAPFRWWCDRHKQWADIVAALSIVLGMAAIAVWHIPRLPAPADSNHLLAIIFCKVFDLSKHSMGRCQMRMVEAAAAAFETRGLFKMRTSGMVFLCTTFGLLRSIVVFTRGFGARARPMTAPTARVTSTMAASTGSSNSIEPIESVWMARRAVSVCRPISRLGAFIHSVHFVARRDYSEMR